MHKSNTDSSHFLCPECYEKWAYTSIHKKDNCPNCGYSGPINSHGFAEGVKPYAKIYNGTQNKGV